MASKPAVWAWAAETMARRVAAEMTTFMLTVVVVTKKVIIWNRVEDGGEKRHWKDGKRLTRVCNYLLFQKRMTRQDVLSWIREREKRKRRAKRDERRGRRWLL